MAFKIAHAASSENYTNYGTAPNQRRTGATPSNPGGNMNGELNITDFTNSFTCIFRPKDKNIGEKIATFMEKAVANGSHIGYSWSGNTGVFDALVNQGITDPSQITTKVNCDCATLVGAAVYFSGIRDSRLRAMITAKEEEILLGTGQFTKITNAATIQKGIGIERGDILWRKGHTAVSLNTDVANARYNLNDNSLTFKNDSGTQTGTYPSNGTMLLRDNKIRTKDAYANAYYLYSEKGSASYTLLNDMTYLVTFTQRNSTTSNNDAVWIISTHKNNSHLFALKSSSSTSASVNKLTLTINRGCVYGRISITCLT